MMRVTSQMISKMAAKTGLPIGNRSLLDYVNNDYSSNPFLSAINKSSAASSVKKTSYEKLGQAAEQFLQQTSFFTGEGEESVFEQARKSGSNQEIYDGVEDFVKGFNATVNALKSAYTPLNELYRQSLQEVVSENDEALKKIGITVSKDGTIAIDREKLKKADVDSLEEVFGASGSFSAKMAFLAGRIADNAQVNVQSLYSQYTSSGSNYSALLNQYNFWG